jgi:hypothetical protein
MGTKISALHHAEFADGRDAAPKRLAEDPIEFHLIGLCHFLELGHGIRFRSLGRQGKFRAKQECQDQQSGYRQTGSDRVVHQNHVFLHTLLPEVNVIVSQPRLKTSNHKADSWDIPPMVV